MLTALLLLASAAEWIPMRWGTSDPSSLDLLKGTPVNCLLLEKDHWSAAFNSEAAKSQLVTFAVIHPSADAIELAQKAVSLKFDGIVLEGDFDGRITSALADSKTTVIQLAPRAKMRFDAAPIVGTSQGVWPGIQVDDGGAAKAAPSGGPWINTNSGFLRFIRAVSSSPVWMGYTPPPNHIVTGERYLQAICDSAIVGARWIIAFDADFAKRFYARDAAALKDWKRMAEQISFFEQQKEWRSWKPLGLLAIVQDIDSGALLSGGVLDMIAVKHTPVRPVPSRSLGPEALGNSKLAVNVSPASLSDQQKEALRAFARSGGTLLSGPPSWKFPAPAPGEITLSENDVKMLDDIWKEVNTLTGRRNLGVRLFNVSSMLSNIVESADGKRAVLHLVNYSGYPVENVTVHLLGKYKTARVLAPGVQPKELGVYDNEEGTGIDIDSVNVSATIVVEQEQER
jgi:hypothetical protein